ncbi:hypothetical protein O9H85_33450 [Paenibacillus filicis]|uniref:Uncharacterized protein n=1 Tax=Paenibacillus gyeongsangnamensis TaxID=3388067 RepID=A0ABT4QJW8_9BACL|nr:hypothetical protein [Paenibacillus filicis]MCZ8517171.1 hypothetical protein [Paenibacillus filicis]
MERKEKLYCLFERLSERDQMKAFEFIQELAYRHKDHAEEQDVMELYGKNYFVVPD